MGDIIPYFRYDMKLCRTYGALGDECQSYVGYTHAYAISPLQGFSPCSQAPQGAFFVSFRVFRVQNIGSAP